MDGTANVNLVEMICSLNTSFSWALCDKFEENVHLHRTSFNIPLGYSRIDLEKTRDKQVRNEKRETNTK